MVSDYQRYTLYTQSQQALSRMQVLPNNTRTMTRVFQMAEDHQCKWPPYHAFHNENFTKCQQCQMRDL